MSTATQVREALAWLERRGSARNVAGMARYGIVAKKVYGVTVADIRRLGKQLGRDHALAQALWRSGWYEARLLASFVEEPGRVTPAQMDRWAAAFDNWAICDTICFHLFDDVPHAWKKVGPWARDQREFVRRAAFALLASLALHDKHAEDAPFLKALPLIERAATDQRNFVKKGVSWALRSVGARSTAVHAASLAVARRLVTSDSAAARWVGRDALKDLERPITLRRIAASDKKRAAAKARRAR